MLDPAPRIIAFTGPKTCGKDTAAKILFSQNQAVGTWLFRRTPLAEGVKNICHHTFGWSHEDMDDPIFKETLLEDWPNIEPRWAMMDIANWMREKYGGAVWVKALEKRIEEHERTDPNGAYVITDFRFPEELEWLQAHKALILYVNRPSAEEALYEAQKAGDAKALNPSEIHYELTRKHADYIIDNTGTVLFLHSQVLNVVKTRFGHWNFW